MRKALFCLPLLLFFAACSDEQDRSAVNQGPAVSGQRGEVLSVKPAPASLLPAGAKSSQVISYISETPEGRLVRTSGTLLLPEREKNKPLMLFQHGLTGVADTCAPSRANSDIAPYFSFYRPAFSTWLLAGHPLLLPDYQGLGVPGEYRLGNGVSHARSSLDMVRAVLSFKKDLNQEFVNLGHSQGGQSAVVLSEISKSYLGRKSLGNVIYSPVAFYEAQAKLGSIALQNPGPAGALLFLLLRAATLEAGLDPREVFVDEVFATDGPLAVRGASLWARAQRECLLALVDTFRSFPGSKILRSSDWQGDKNLEKVAKELKAMEERSSEPLLFLQGGLDTIIPEWVSRLYLGQLPRAEYKAFPLAEHNTIVLQSRFFVLKTVERWSKNIGQR